MEQVEYEKMGEFESHYWWHRGKLHLIETMFDKYLGKSGLRSIEMGCGTGEVMDLAQKWGDVTGVEISKSAVDYCKSRGFKNLILGDVTKLSVAELGKDYDLALSMDVLEHVQDDVAAMKKIHEILKPGGYFFVSVPAYKFLWSNHDEALHHKRRYHSLEIKQKLKDSGFEILQSTHFVAALFFPIAFVRLMSNFVRRSAYPKSSYVAVPDFLNNLFITLLKVESTFTKFMNLPLGTTLFVVARKNEAS